MGKLLFDCYSVAHAGFGYLAAQFRIPFIIWVIIHMIFEYAENTEWGMRIINQSFMPFWIGPKDYADSPVNILGDNLATIAGYAFGHYHLTLSDSLKK